MKAILTIPFIALLSFSGISQGKFEQTPQIRAAYDLVMSLRFDEAKTQIEAIKRDDPQNLLVHYVENYLDFFTCYINEDKTEFNRLERNKDARIALVKTGDPNSPYYLYLQSSIRLHWALARLKFSEYFTAFREVNKAFKLLNKNQKQFPDFMPNKKDLGILHAMVGTIPDNYKWGVELFTNMSGSINQGKEEIKTVLNYAENNEFIYEQEARVLYAYLLMHLGNQSSDAWQLLNSSKLNPEKNPIAAFVLANVAMRTGKNDKAIEFLKNRPTGSQFHPFPYFDFMLANAKLRRLDKDADQYFLKYLKEFKGLHFIKESYARLSWHAIINDDLQQFYAYNEQVKSNGTTTTGGDKNAQMDAEIPIIHHKALLQARLLFDGGYYQKGYDILSPLSLSDFPDERSKLEFTYRTGRLLHKLQKHPEAIGAYEKTINNGKDKRWYFACNAALQNGLIFEELKNNERARFYFEKCISISPSEHKTALHQQAKAGLERVK